MYWSEKGQIHSINTNWLMFLLLKNVFIMRHGKNGVKFLYQPFLSYRTTIVEIRIYTLMYFKAKNLQWKQFILCTLWSSISSNIKKCAILFDCFYFALIPPPPSLRALNNVAWSMGEIWWHTMYQMNIFVCRTQNGTNLSLMEVTLFVAITKHVVEDHYYVIGRRNKKKHQ